MNWYKASLDIKTEGQGFYNITEAIEHQLQDWQVEDGLAFLFLQHTSASLVINESFAASARRDMETFLEKLAPRDETWYEHTMEGSDDSPAHLRTMLTHTSLTIPIDEGHLHLGTWQGLYLAEHRRHRQRRQVLLRVLAIHPS